MNRMIPHAPATVPMRPSSTTPKHEACGTGQDADGSEGRDVPFTSPSEPYASVGIPPVANLLVKTALALQPRADLLALLARLQRLGVIAVAAPTLCIQSEPRLNQWRLRVGRGGKSDDEAEHGHRERDGHDHPPHPPPARRVRARGSRRIVGRPHPARILQRGRGASTSSSSADNPRHIGDAGAHHARSGRRAVAVLSRQTALREALRECPFQTAAPRTQVRLTGEAR